MATFSTHGMCDGTAADSEAAAEAAPRWQDGNSKANLGSGSKGSHRTSTTDSVVFAIIVQGPTNSCCRAADIPRQPPRLFCGAPLRPPQRRRLLLSPPFLVMTGGCRQAVRSLLRQDFRSPAAKKQRYITSNDRYKSRAFSSPLVSQCQKSDIIKETLRYYIVPASPCLNCAWPAAASRPLASWRLWISSESILRPKLKT